MKLLTSNPVGRPAKPRVVRVRIRLCARSCKACKRGHEFTEPLEAERNGSYVKITEAHPIWFNAVIVPGDFRFVEEGE